MNYEEVTAGYTRAIESFLGEHHDALYMGIGGGILLTFFVAMIIRDKIRK